MSASVAFGPGDATVKVNGEAFRAVDAPQGRCTAGPRCHFAHGFGCELARLTSGFADNRCGYRADGRSIVWVPAATKENQQ